MATASAVLAAVSGAPAEVEATSAEAAASVWVDDCHILHTCDIVLFYADSKRTTFGLSDKLLVDDW